MKNSLPSFEGYAIFLPLSAASMGDMDLAPPQQGNDTSRENDYSNLAWNDCWSKPAHEP
jgi:hypothetical protein